MSSAQRQRRVRETFPTRKPGMAEKLSGAPERPDAEPPKANKIAPTFMPSSQLEPGNNFCSVCPPPFFDGKALGRGSRKDALLRCDTHDMRRLLRRYLICFCLFQSRIFSGTVLPTYEERAGNTHSCTGRIKVGR